MLVKIEKTSQEDEPKKTNVQVWLGSATRFLSAHFQNFKTEVVLKLGDHTIHFVKFYKRKDE